MVSRSDARYRVLRMGGFECSQQLQSRGIVKTNGFTRSICEISDVSIQFKVRVSQKEVGKRSLIIFHFLVTFRSLLLTLLSPFRHFFCQTLGARVVLQHTVSQRSTKGSEKVSGEGFWGRVLGKGSGEGFWGRVPRRVLRRGSEKGVSRRCLERPLGEYDSLGVRPKTPFPGLLLQQGDERSRARIPEEQTMHPILGPRLVGDKPKVRFPAKICSFLRKSAPLNPKDPAVLKILRRINSLSPY